MPASTNRLDLYLPGGGSSGLITPDETFDIDKINDNMRKIDAAMGTTICTSTTRPSTPYPGQSIYETDTYGFLVWTGTDWFGSSDVLRQQVSATVFSVVSNSLPPVGTRLLRQYDKKRITTNSNGDASWVFPTPFPGGVLYAPMPTRILFNALGMTVQQLAATQSASQLNFRVYDSNGTPLPNATMDFSLEAVGW